jgi:uncharacterized protein (TIGR02246 family)
MTTTTLNIRVLFDRYAEAWATCDPDAIVELHSPDTTFWLRSGGQPVRGRDAVSAAFAGVFAQWPEFGFDVHRVLIGPDHWILDWALTAVLTGVDGTPRPVRLDCIDVVTIDADGLVTRKDTFVDYLQLQNALTGAR